MSESIPNSRPLFPFLLVSGVLRSPLYTFLENNFPTIVRMYKQIEKKFSRNLDVISRGIGMSSRLSGFLGVGGRSTGKKREPLFLSLRIFLTFGSVVV